MSDTTRINPITKLDYPDPDVIRVEDTFYMVSTTMHFMPGCEILRSYDLINWEHAAYVYESLDHTEAQQLIGNQNIYGKGMWAATLRYHNNRFYICFVANDTKKTYLYTASNIDGPWEKKIIKGFYHDCSLLFDDDERIYIVYGNKEIWLTELANDFSGKKEGGLHRKIVSDAGNERLGFEGSHFYKINGRYYVFFIHSRRDRWMRTEACFMAESLDGEFTGGDCFEDTLGYCGQGVAQGGIVDTLEGNWYAILFQDRGAVGRIPVLLPVTWKNNRPVFGIDGKVPVSFETKSTKENITYAPLVGSDDFKSEPTLYGTYLLLPRWQFNHEPWKEYYELNGREGYYQITMAKLCHNLTEAPNTLTQRMTFPECGAYVTIDANDLNEGDYAGICALQGCYGMAAVTKRDGSYYVVIQEREDYEASYQRTNSDDEATQECEAVLLPSPIVKIKVSVDFEHMKDEAQFYYEWEKEWVKIGRTHKLYFKLDHFTGCRFGLFAYATRKLGGKARFYDFVYEK